MGLFMDLLLSVNMGIMLLYSLFLNNKLHFYNLLILSYDLFNYNYYKKK